jgi:hypothetical protein
MAPASPAPRVYAILGARLSRHRLEGDPHRRRHPHQRQRLLLPLTIDGRPAGRQRVVVLK